MKLASYIAGAVLLLPIGGVSAGQKSKPAPPRPAAKAPARPRPARMPAGGAPKNPPHFNNPMAPAQQLMRMTPEQRERVFEKLPSGQQARLRQQLEKLDNLRPAERERIARQVQALSALPPEQQRIVGQRIAAMNHLPPERIKPVRDELLALMNAPEEDRASRINSADFKKKFSPEEQKILTDLSANLPAGYPLAGR